MLGVDDMWDWVLVVKCWLLMICEDGVMGVKCWVLMFCDVGF